jgi:hypothetical protein
VANLRSLPPDLIEELAQELAHVVVAAILRDSAATASRGDGENECRTDRSNHKEAHPATTSREVAGHNDIERALVSNGH